MLLRSRPVACMTTPRPAIHLDESELKRTEVVRVDLRHHPLNVCKVLVLPLKVDLAGSVVRWCKALQDNVLVLAVRGALLGCDGIKTVAAPVLLVCKVIGIFI